MHLSVCARLVYFSITATMLAFGHSTAAAAQTRAGQTIRGEVIDRTAQMPLPGANVVVLGTDPLLGTMTDAEGWFVLEDVPLGRHDISISFLGYEPITLRQVLVTSGKEVVLNAALREQVVEGEEVVVVSALRKDRALNDLAYVSARSFSVEETRRYAGGLDDPARMASAFAGITTSGGVQENALIIRGNAPKGVLWRLEGVEIPNPNHFAGLSVAGGGGVTLFSSQLLADSDFFTGAFPAEYGNALAGVFDMNLRTGNRASREHTAQLGVLGIEVASEGPFAQGKPSTYLFNYRYSTLGLLLPVLPTEDLPTFQDLSFNLSFPTRKRGRFAVWGIGGLDAQRGSATEDSSAWEYETWDRVASELDLATGAGGLSHTFILGRTSYLHSSAALTFSRTALEQQRIGNDLVLRDDLSIRTTNGRFIITSTLNHTFGARHTNRTGFSVQQLFYDLDLAVVREENERLVPVAMGSGSTTLLQAYAQSKVDLSSRFTGNVGTHLQHFALTGQTTVEPRVGLRWDVREGQALSAGYGLHSQIEDLRIYLARPLAGGEALNRALDVARAHHFVLGYDQSLGAVARLKIEAYYQSLFDVPVIADSSYSLLNFEQDFRFSEALVNDGAGENVGVELTMERFLRDGYYYLLTGSVFRSRYRGGDGVWRNTRFDRRYAANALFGKEFVLGGDDLFGVNGRIASTGGQRRSPVDRVASRAAEEVIYDEHRAFEERDPGLLVLDLTLTYRRNHARRSAVWALQVKNLLGAQELSMDYNFATRRVERVKEGFPLPVLSYKLEF